MKQNDQHKQDREELNMKSKTTFHNKCRYKYMIVLISMRKIYERWQGDVCLPRVARFRIRFDGQLGMSKRSFSKGAIHGLGIQKSTGRIQKATQDIPKTKKVVCWKNPYLIENKGVNPVIKNHAHPNSSSYMLHIVMV